MSQSGAEQTGRDWTPPAFAPAGRHAPGAESHNSSGMKRFRDVLLVAASDEGPFPRWVFERALGLAKRDKAKLTLFDVVHESELFREILPPGRLARTRRLRRLPLMRLAEAAREQGVESEAELAAGKPYLEIIRKVRRARHDLVITKGGRDLSAGVIDGTTMQLMRKCPCAIWVLRPQAVSRPARILAAIDADLADPENDSLNRKIMELATSMAKLEGGVLHVVHVWETPGAPPGSSGVVSKRWEATARSGVERRLAELLAEYDPGSEARVHLVAGRPAVAIPELASEERIDLLVMGTVCRTGARGFFVGNTAEGVLERVDCSLLTVKPDDFVSPI